MKIREIFADYRVRDWLILILLALGITLMLMLAMYLLTAMMPNPAFEH